MVYYFDGATGFSDSFDGVSTASIDDGLYPAATWMLQSGFDYSADMTQDGNGDGITLLHAYAFGLDPEATNSPADLPQAEVVDGKLTLVIDQSSPSTHFDVQTSTDLINWSRSGMTNSYEGETRTITVPTSDEQRFLKINILLMTSENS